MNRLSAYLSVMFLMCCFMAYGQRQDLKTEQIGLNEGLSQSTVRCIFQDRKGLMWFGTKDGLNRYDGYKFIVYKKDNSSNSLGSNDIKAVTDDKAGNLWIATWEGGLNVYHPSLNSFSRFRKKTGATNSISSNFIEALCRDSYNNIWVGTADNGLDMYDQKSAKFIHYANQPGNPTTLTGNSISAVFEDSKKNIWVGTTSGLNLLDRKKGSFKQFTHDSRNKASISDNNIKFIFEDKRHVIWIGTYGGGLNSFNTNTDQFKVYTTENSGISSNVLLSMGQDNHDHLWIGTENGGLNLFDPLHESFISYTLADNNQTGVSSNTINAITRDQKGNLWLGTSNGGINLVKRDADNFRHYKHEQHKNSLSNNVVNSIYEDSKSNLWIATDGGGLDLFNRKEGKFTSHKHLAGKTNSLSSDYVLSVTEALNGDIWTGTWGSGISVFNPATQQFKHYRHQRDVPGSLSSDYAFYLFRDSENRIWVGTYGGGLDRYLPESDSFKHYAHNNSANSISSDHILSINEDHAGNLLICTDGAGLAILNPETDSFTFYKSASGSKGLSNNSVSSVFEDEQHYLWVGTNDGLNRIDRAANVVKKYDIANGLSSNLVRSIVGDRQHNLWIGTSNGLSKLDLKSGQFKNYTSADGLQSNEFKFAHLLSKTGQIYLGGVNGFNEFFPDKIATIAFDPPILFTGFQIFNKEVSVAQQGSDSSPLKSNIAYADTITLSYRESVITFDFASLNYVSREKKQYRYILEGFDRQWHDLGVKNNLTYTNLDPGSYVLKVKGFTNGGMYSDKIARLYLIIKPPFYKTWWFISLVLLFIAGLVTFIFYRRVASIRRQNKMLEAEVEKRTQEIRSQQEHIVYQNQELEKTVNELEISNQTKDRFFSILAHDLRNPIAAISGISENLKKQLPQLSKADLSQYISHINNSAGAVLDLLINLLAWARTHERKLTCFPSHLNLRELVMKNQILVEQQVRNKNIHLSINIDPSYAIFADKDMIDTAIRNILGNCIKFTPSYGKIIIEAEELQDEIKLIFHDTGLGMTEEQVDHLFNMEKQILSKGANGEKGTGLGLMITKEFVEANKGSLIVSSLLNEGSTFIFRLPKGKMSASDGPVMTQDEQATPYLIANYFEDKFPEQQGMKLKGKRILFVDDNQEIRAYLRLMLSPAFEIVEAADGEAGIKAAIEFQPDLIISDMVMPVMSGLELCKAMKKNELTSHIPIILLTSQTTEANQLSGYEAGADAYLLKPLSQPILFQVIFNLIMTQIRMRSKFASSDEIYPDETTYNQLDKEFLDKVIAYVEQHISDPDLDSRKICEITAMSRTVLYAKFKMLTGQGVHDFIKSIRVKKGLQLLLEGKYNINQISYEVGFNTPSYFSKSFIKQFGIAPREYLNKMQQAAKNK